MNLRYQALKTRSTSIQLPASKSEINRLMILAFLAKKPFVIHNFSFCDDTKVVYDFFNFIGCKILIKNDSLHIDTSKIQLNQEKNYDVNVKLSGTAFRFLLPLLAFCNANFQIHGEESLSKRPIDKLVKILREMGAKIENVSQNSLPLKIFANSQVDVKKIYIDEVVESSQFLSSLLLIAPKLPLGFHIHFEESQISSISYVFMTLSMLKRLGIVWNWKDTGLILEKNFFDCYEYKVSADWTAASYFFAATAITGVETFFPNLDVLSPQPDTEQLGIWTDLGLLLNETETGISCQKNHFDLQSFTLNLENTPDLFQTFAVLTAFKVGKYFFQGLKTLKFKETDRLQAMKNELTKCGLKVEISDDECVILNEGIYSEPSLSFETYHDHRMAMSLSLLAVLFSEIQIQKPEVVQKSFPNFWQEISKIGIQG